MWFTAAVSSELHDNIGLIFFRGHKLGFDLKKTGNRNEPEQNFTSEVSS